MAHKTQTKKPKWTAPEFCRYWAKKHSEKTGRIFHINYRVDAATMKRVMGVIESNAEILLIIDFVFSGHKKTDYLKRKGYPIGLLPYTLNEIRTFLDNPGTDIPQWELNVDVPIWDDERTAYLWGRIKVSEMDDILKHVKKKETWLILLGKLEHQKGFIPAKVKWFYEKWRMKEKIKRKGVK